MTSRPLLPRWAFWALVAAMLLKAAVPLLASASAHAQGKTVVEVCTVYGVATVALDSGASHEPASSAAVHGDHCTLSPLLAFAAPPAGAATPALPGPARDAASVSRRVPEPPDACARWVAGLQHAPPARA